jgi:eukaryotic-like serine/threonine-protein kinase
MIETLGQYKILGRVGVGGLGELYRGRDEPRGRTVTIEVLPASLSRDPDWRAGLLREADESRKLSHPNIAALYEIDDEAGQLFLVYDVPPGQTLQAAMGGQPMNVRRALDIGVEIADALAEAHAFAILHRFLKPTSVIISAQGSAKVIDFGLAAWLGDEGIRREDLAYVSPEQQRYDVLDERADIFSLGVVVFEMLTGTMPQMSRHAPPADVDVVLRKMLAEERDARYQSAASVAADLRSVAAHIDARRAAGERR